MGWRLRRTKLRYDIPHRVDAASTYGLFWLRVLAAVATASVIGLAIVAPLLAGRIDQRERKREVAVVDAGLEQIRQSLLGRVGSDANWDPAVINLENAFNENWAQQTLTSKSGDDVTTRLVTVTGPDGSVQFARNHAEPVSKAMVADVQSRLAPLIAQMRVNETFRMAGRSIPHVRSAADWVLGSDVVLLSGRPMLVVASLVGSDTGTVSILHPHTAILAYWSDLPADMLPELASRFLLRDARIVTAEASLGQNNVILRSNAGQPIATLRWTTDRPGHRLLMKVLAPLGLVVIAFAVTVVVAYRHAVAGSRALRTSQAEAYYLAFHDGLTGLPNRRLFNDRLTQALARADRNGEDAALLLLDLDRFKLVNDSYGHQTGDDLLQEVARRLLRVCRAEDTCARLGGDEFVILVPDAGATAAAALATRITDELSPFANVAGKWLNCQASIGISVGSSIAFTPVELLRQADLALYKAKEQARGSYRFFELEMDHALLDRAQLSTDLMLAVASGKLEVAYQPQFDGERMVGVEALSRWNHPERGAIPPSFFIPLAEECGLIEKLSNQTLRRVLTDCLQWPDLTVAINLSASQLHQPQFVDDLEALVRQYHVAPRSIELEITESVLMSDNNVISQTLSELHSRGFRIALDDFGTSYSSLGYLSKFNFDRIKIDRSFIFGLPSGGRSVLIVKSIIALANALEMAIIAEGVETLEQQIELADLGCRSVQGFLTGGPMSSSAIALMHKHQKT